MMSSSAIERRRRWRAYMGLAQLERCQFGYHPADLLGSFRPDGWPVCRRQHQAAEANGPDRWLALRGRYDDFAERHWRAMRAELLPDAMAVYADWYAARPF